MADTAPRDVETLPHRLVANWIRLMEPARGESCSSGQRRGPAALGKDKLCHPRIRNPAMYLQLQQTGDENGDSLGRYRSARCGSPNRIGWLPIGASTWREFPLRTTSRSRRTRGGQFIIPGSEMLPCIYNSGKTGTKTQISRVCSAPHGVETPTALAGC